MLKRLSFIALLTILISCSPTTPKEPMPVPLMPDVASLTQTFGSGPCGIAGSDCCSTGTPCQGALVCNDTNDCVRCGKLYLPCCGDGTCHDDLVCSLNNTCEECGEWHHVCCPGGTCNEEDQVCYADNTCDHCGYFGYVCCPGDPPTCLNGKCSNGICENCGVKYENCCNGTDCDEGLVCTNSGICTECGGFLQPPCSDGECRGWMKLYDGKCDNPYTHGQSTELAACELAEPGWKKKDLRDWCFWYLAYHTGNASLCDEVEDIYIQGQCKYLANPADYFIMP